jgi:taurine dioxygenase
MRMTTSTLQVTALGPALGAQVDGFDAAAPSDEALAALRQALLDHQVLVLHAPDLTVDEHLALARRFGDVEVHAFFPNLGPGQEHVSVLDSDAGTRASMWHTDETFLAEPPLGTFLHARIIPPVGGDTCWSSSTAAYAALSAPMRRYLDGLEAEHALSRTTELAWQVGNAPPDRFADALAQERSTVHPVVRAHPETGEPALFVNPTYTRRIVGVGKDESDAVLQLLYRHAITERFVYRHRWREGDLVVWDNRCTMHHALFDFAGRRRMHRVSMLGDCPVGPRA